MIIHCIHHILKAFYLPVKRVIPYPIFVYLAVGATNTVLNIGLFILLNLSLLSYIWSVEISTLISFTVTVFTGFWLNKNFAFNDAGEHSVKTRKQFARYLLVALQGQVSAYLLTKGMILLLTLNASVAYTCTTIIMLTLNYFLQRYYTFRVKKIPV